MSETVDKIMAEALSSHERCCAICTHYYRSPNGVMGYCRVTPSLYPKPVDMFDGCTQWASVFKRKPEQTQK